MKKINKKFSRKKSFKEIKKIRDAQLGKPRPFTTGDKNGMWKGHNASYSAIHHWVKRNFKQPDKCELCKISKTEKRLNWANKDHKYTRDRKDWLYLCYSCHTQYDIKHFNNRPNFLNKQNTFTHRQCSVCRETLPLTTKFFCHSKSHSLGFRYICKNCQSKQFQLKQTKD